jgi:hypothetical protein
MRRRGFLITLSSLPLLAFVKPEDLPRRRAVFEEVGASLRMTLALPKLLRKHDREAMASIDSGFDTTIEYTLRLWQQLGRGNRKFVATRELVVKIRRDPWKKRYVVSTGDERGWTRRYFEDRDAAIAAAVRLERVRISAVSALERGDSRANYFVEVLALRNPLRKRGPGGTDSASGRGQGRDLEWFGRLIETLAGERARAEEVVHVRTNLFYLVSR